MMLVPKHLAASFAAAVMLLFSLSSASYAAAGEEKYQYDALGRLRQVTYADGRTIQYTYDAAGNRKTVVSGGTGGGQTQLGTITLVGAAYPNGCSGCTGSFWIDVKNTGAGTLTGVVFSLANVGVGGCSPSAGTTSIAPNQTVRFSWYKASAASVNCGPRMAAANATNSPASWSNL
jgi:YD repeat-containing protein